MDWDRVRSVRNNDKNKNEEEEKSSHYSEQKEYTSVDNGNSSNLWDRVRNQRNSGEKTTLGNRIKYSYQDYSRDVSDISDFISGKGYKDKHTFSAYTDRLNKHLNELDSYLGEVDKDSETYTSLLDSKKKMQILQDTLSKQSEYFSQFANEDAYKYQVEQQKKKENIAKMTDEALDSALEGTKKSFWERVSDAISTSGLSDEYLKTHTANLNADSSVKSGILKSAEENKKEIYQKEIDNTFYQQEKTARAIRKLDELPNDVKNLIEEYTILDREEEEKSFQDKATVLVNGLTGAGGNYNIDNTASRREEIAKELNALGVEDWVDLVEYNRIRRDEEYYKPTKEQWAEDAKEHPVLTSLTSIPMNATKFMGVLKSIESMGEDTPLNPNSPYFFANDFVDTTRSTVMENNTPWYVGDSDVDLHDKFYSIVMSSGDSLFNSMLSPGIGTGKLPSVVGKVVGDQLGISPLAFSSAASDYAKQVAENGGTSEQAALSGLVAGINEMLWESISIGNLKTLSPKNLTAQGIKSVISKEGIKKTASELLKSMGVNASEEFNTELSNLVFDYLINGGTSAYALAREEALSQGLNDAEARSYAQKAMLKQSLEAGFDGALQGLLMGGGASVLNTSKQAIGTAIDDYRRGSQIQGNDNIMALNDTVQGMEGNQKLKKASAAITEAVANDKKVSSRKVGAIQRKGYLQALNKGEEITTTAVVSRLKELGDKNPTQTAKAVIQQINGKELTSRQSELLEGNAAKQVVEEYSSDVAVEWTANLQQKLDKEADRVRSFVNASSYNSKLLEEPKAVKNRRIESISVSESGETVDVSTGEKVEIETITSTKGGKTTVRLTNGSVVPVASLELNSTDAELYSVAANFDTKTAKNFVKMYQGGNVETYTAEFMDAYEHGYEIGNINTQNIAKHLAPSVKQYAVLRGVAEKQSKVDKKQNAINKIRNRVHYEVTSSKITDEKGNEVEDIEGLSELQKRNLEATKALAKATGISIIVYESELKDGKRVGANGYYADGKIYVDINAGNNRQMEGLMLVTLSHELTHYIQDYSPKMYESLKKYVLETYLLEGDKTIDRLVAHQIEKAKKNGRTISYEEALEEVVAEGCERMLEDSNAPSQLAKENKSLYKKICEFIDALVKKLKDAFEGVEPQSAEGQIIAKHKERLEQMQKLWDNALVDAVHSATVLKDKPTDVKGKNTKFQGRDYSYNTLVSKPDMHITLVDNKGKTNRTDVVREAKANASRIGNFDAKTDSVSVFVDDIGENVVLSTKGLRHGLRRIDGSQDNANFIVTPKAGEIIKNSVRINEAIPTKENATSSYILIGVAKNDAGDIFIVRSVVNKFNNELSSMDVLYAINAKKESAVLNAPRLVAKPLSVTDSTISIADLLTHVNNHFPDVLSEDVLRRFGYDRRPESVYKDDDIGKSVLFQEREYTGLTNREILLGALENAEGLSVADKNRITQYKANVDKLEGYESELALIRKKIKGVAFTKGADRSSLPALKAKANALSRNIDSVNNILINMEALEPVKKVLTDRRKVAEQQRLKEMRSGIKKEMRHNYLERTQSQKAREHIKKTVKAIDQLLRKGDKAKHIPEEMRGAVVDFLNVFVQKDENRISHREGYTRKDGVVVEGGDFASHSGVFNYKDLDRLAKAYMKLAPKNTEGSQNHLSYVYSEDVQNCLNNLSELLENKRLSELSAEELLQLKDVVDHFYKIIKEGNQLFVNGKKEYIDTLGNAVIDKCREHSTNKLLGALANVPFLSTEAKAKIANSIGSFQQEVTPIYFFKRLGGPLNKIYQDFRDGQDRYAQIVKQTKVFLENTRQRFNFYDWDTSDTLELVTAQGETLELTRQQAFTLYATAKREDINGTTEHLIKGGITFQDDVKIGKDKKSLTYNRKPYQLSAEHIFEVAKWLTDEQKRYIDTMVGYLSKEMGGLGNKATMQLYNIELFREDYYFPFNSDRNFISMRFGEVEQNIIKQASFTNALTKGANNPLVMSDFDIIWSTHCQQMALYSSVTVPMTNLNRVLNYRTPADEELSIPEVSVASEFEDAYGHGSLEYLKTLMTDLNGGITSDSREGIISKGISTFKKSAVFGSASVTLQQFSAIGRAQAYINPKYFISKPVTKADWEEVMQYNGVAVIKDIGSFDTGTGKGTAEWIASPSYEKVIKDRSKALKKEKSFGKVKLIKEFADDALSWAPGKADQITWCHIWNACKKETAAETGLSGEELKRTAAKRFRDVIDYTQVYDSTLSKSGFMRSKSAMVKMTTAFMAEPTVSANMVIDALCNFGKSKEQTAYALRTVASLISAFTINAMLKSLATAPRDDDEDETMIEKYLGEVVANFLSDINPMSMFPYLRDINSLVNGYTVDRSDMSVISDVITSITNISSKASEGTIEFKDVTDLVGTVSAFFGIPVKNLLRDFVYSPINLYENVKNNGIGLDTDGIERALMSAVGIDTSIKAEYQRIYEGYENGKPNQEALRRALLHLTRNGKSPNEAQEALESGVANVLMNSSVSVFEGAYDRISGNMGGYQGVYNELYNLGIPKDIVVKALRSADNKITGAAQDYVDGDLESFNEVVEFLVNIGWEDAEEKILSYAEDLDPSEDTVKEEYLYATKDLYDGIRSNNFATVKKEVVAKHRANGKTQEEAEESVNASVKSQVKEHFMNTDITEATAYSYLTSYAGVSANDAYWLLDEWSYYAKNDATSGYSSYRTLYESINDGEYDVIYQKIQVRNYEARKEKYPNEDIKTAYEEIDKNISTQLQKQIKTAYLNGEISYDTAYSLLVDYCNKTSAKAVKAIAGWDELD